MSIIDEKLVKDKQLLFIAGVGDVVRFSEFRLRHDTISEGGAATLFDNLDFLEHRESSAFSLWMEHMRASVSGETVAAREKMCRKIRTLRSSVVKSFLMLCNTVLQLTPRLADVYRRAVHAIESVNTASNWERNGVFRTGEQVSNPINRKYYYFDVKL